MNEIKLVEKNRRWSEAAMYVISFLLGVWIAERLMRLRHADIHVPFIYGGDGLFYSVLIKAILKNGWYLNNPDIGAPYGAEMHDFPQPDNFHYFLMKMMGWFLSDWAAVYNTFFLLTFPLTTFAALYVFRRFGVDRGPATLGALLYTFTFFHMSRNLQHLQYTAYYPVPLMVMVMLWICSGKLSLESIKQEFATRPFWKTKWFWSLLILLLISSTGGAYYSFFAMMILVSVAIYLAIRRRSWKEALLPMAASAVLFGAFLINVSPNLIYRMKNGASIATMRLPGESEFYGLKIAQLLVPANEHRIKLFARIKTRYNATPLSNENTDSSLGIMGSLGFLFLIAWALYRNERTDDDHPLGIFNHLSILNISATLIGTIGGFGSLFAHLIMPQIRAYNRISVYIAFFSLFTFILLLNALLRKYFQSGALRIVSYVLIAALIVLGVLDQTKKYILPDFKVTKAEFEADREFIKRIEAQTPPGSMIFQLPYTSFPEGTSYDHLRAYLHSDHLRWSYGAMKGRSSDAWQLAATSLPNPEMIETIAAAGFAGVFIDRIFYPDQGQKIEADVAALAETPPLISNQGRFVYFDLSKYRAKLIEKNVDQQKALYPLLTYWRGKFYPVDSPTAHRWCKTTGELEIENRLDRVRKVSLDFTVAGMSEGNLDLESAAFTKKLRLSPEPTTVQTNLTVPPGKLVIRFTSDIPPVAPTSTDPRTLSFYLTQFRLTELP
jgi:phosphoglycerol transferase